MGAWQTRVLSARSKLAWCCALLRSLLGFNTLFKGTEDLGEGDNGHQASAQGGRERSPRLWNPSGGLLVHRLPSCRYIRGPSKKQKVREHLDHHQTPVFLPNTTRLRVAQDSKSLRPSSRGNDGEGDTRHARSRGCVRCFRGHCVLAPSSDALGS